MKNKRKMGDQLEDYVVQKLKPIDKYAKRSPSSGASGVKSDVLNNFFQIECKARSTKDVTFKQDVWDKLCASMGIHAQKVPLYVMENKTKNRFAVLDLDDFFDIVYNALKEDK